MLKSIYTPLSGAISQERVLEVISNNLANLNTTGFKGDTVTFTLLPSEPYKNYHNPIPPANYKVDLEKVMPLKGNDLAYVGVADLSRDDSQGPAINTKNPLNLMIEGQGYFTVQTKTGQRHTRAGNLSLNANGALVTNKGDPILGEKGVIYVKGQNFEVNLQGEVFSNGSLVDRLQIEHFPNEGFIERTGDGYLYYSGDPRLVKKIKVPTIQQGFLEGSNVNPIKNLTAMIVAHRSYEAYQKAVSNYDKMMEKSSNSLGEVRA